MMRKYLVVNQYSKLAKVLDGFCFLTPSYSVWEDSGEIVNFPVLSHNKDRKRIPVNGKTVWGITFAELCRLFPNDVKEFASDTTALWGTGLYVAGPDGFPMLHDADWDTSD